VQRPYKNVRSIEYRTGKAKEGRDVAQTKSASPAQICVDEALLIEGLD
jgi:hypothetical protein